MENTAKVLQFGNFKQADMPRERRSAEYEAVKKEVEKEMRKQKIRENKRIAKYFFKQRMIGYSLLISGTAMVVADNIYAINHLDHMGMMIGAAGLYAIFSKSMLIVNEYYLNRR